MNNVALAVVSTGLKSGVNNTRSEWADRWGQRSPCRNKSGVWGGKLWAIPAGH